MLFEDIMAEAPAPSRAGRRFQSRLWLEARCLHVASSCTKNSADILPAREKPWMLLEAVWERRRSLEGGGVDGEREGGGRRGKIK